MSLESPKFTKINESFVCQQCGYHVPESSSTCRDHCTKCLYSLHVDDFPGDRLANCFGLLKPVSYEKHKKKGLMILYRCLKCAKLKKNRFLELDSKECDTLDVLLKIEAQS